jgi:outer membrane protein assembly factor BamD
MKIFMIAAALLAAMFLQSCASSRPHMGHIYDCSGKTKEAIAKYNGRHYSSAGYMLSEVNEKCPGFSGADTVIYYLGKCWLAMKKPDDAKLEFERLIQTYSNSPFIEEAHYLAGYSSYRASSQWYLDQTSTKEAMRTLMDFTETYPHSRFVDSAKACIDSCNEKLARKEFGAAQFYEKVDQYEAALVYLNGMKENYPGSKLIPQVNLSIAYNLIKLHRTAEADAVLDDMLEQTKGDQVMLKKIRALKIRAHKQS